MNKVQFLGKLMLLPLLLFGHKIKKAVKYSDMDHITSPKLFAQELKIYCTVVQISVCINCSFQKSFWTSAFNTHVMQRKIYIINESLVIVWGCSQI